MVLILVLLLILSGGATYYRYRNKAPYGGLVPAVAVMLLIVLLVKASHLH